ncbi:MAG TPA: hypothetical protein VGV18_07520 [Verrucomicrobiae bacterium]|nr:hypothetical protein [Verrucomicrobiae bacterium]
MTVLEKAVEMSVPFNRVAGLIVDPADILFDDLSRDTVIVRVRIRNESERRSARTQVRLESAPFGAFVPSRPLATLPVPVLEPGESRELSVAAGRPHPISFGGLDRVPPTTALSALGETAGEPPRQSATGLAALLNLFRGRPASRPGRNTPRTAQPMLPADLWELFGREQPHWAGNVNVFVGDRAVERHIAKALRIYSGRTNLAMFIVGGAGKPDAYAFSLAGLPMDWSAALHDLTNAQTLVVQASDKPIREKQWVQTAGMMLVMLAVRPPIICEDGKLQVHVTRQSCQKTAVVEFDLSPTAQGPGCYAA